MNFIAAKQRGAERSGQEKCATSAGIKRAGSAINNLSQPTEIKLPLSREMFRDTNVN